MCIFFNFSTFLQSGQNHTKTEAVFVGWQGLPCHPAQQNIFDKKCFAGRDFARFFTRHDTHFLSLLTYHFAKRQNMKAKFLAEKPLHKTIKTFSKYRTKKSISKIFEIKLYCHKKTKGNFQNTKFLKVFKAELQEFLFLETKRLESQLHKTEPFWLTSLLGAFSAFAIFFCTFQNLELASFGGLLSGGIIFVLLAFVNLPTKKFLEAEIFELKNALSEIKL